MEARLRARAKGVGAALPWAFIESASNALTGFASTLIVGFLLTPADIGRAGSALAIVILVEIGCAYGIGEALVRHRSIHASLIDSAYTGLLALSVVGALLCCALAYPLGLLYHDREIAWLLVAGSVLVPLSANNIVPVAILTRKMRIPVLVKRGLLAKVSTMVISGVLAYAGFGAWSIMISSIIGSAIAAVTLVGSIGRWPRLRLVRSELIELMSFGRLIGLELLLVTVTTRLFGLLFGIFHGIDALGYFQFAQRLIDEIANLIQGFALRFGLSYFARLERSGENSGEAFLLGTKVITMIAAPVLIGFAVVFPDALTAVIGPRWLPSYSFVVVAAISWTMTLPITLISPLLRARGVQRPVVTYSAVSCALTLAACVATARSPIAAGAVAWGCRHYLAIPAGLWMTTRYLRIPWRRYAGAFATPIASTCLMALAVLIVQAEMAGSSAGRRLLLSICVGIAAYCLASLVLEWPLMGRLRQTWRAKRANG